MRRFPALAIAALLALAAGFLSVGTASALPGPPNVTKVFSQASMNLGGTTTLTYTVRATVNPPGGSALLTGIGFTDSLPAGLVIAPQGVASNTCNGTLTALPGGSTIALAGASLTEGATCIFAVRISSTTPGLKTVGNSPTVSSAGASGTGSASITINAAAAVLPPTITKAFTPDTIYYRASSGLQPRTTTLVLTIANPNPTPLTGVGVIDVLPDQLSGVAGFSPTAGGTCAGAIGYNPSNRRLTLTNETLAGNASCTVTLGEIWANAIGSIANTTFPVQSIEGGESATGATDSLQVNLQPALTEKSFASAVVPVGTPVRMTLRLTNPNRLTLDLGGPLLSTTVVDNFPPGLQVAPVPNPSVNCGGFATLSGVTPGSTSVTFTMTSWFDFASCEARFDVVATTAGVITNTTQPSTSTPATVPSTGDPASATVTAGGAPGFSKTFSPNPITVGGSSILTFTISAALATTGITFTDPLPAGLVVANPNNLTSTCGGSPNAVPGSTQISLSGGSLPATGSCQLSVSVTATVTGSLRNETGPLTSDNAPSSPGAIASLVVNAAPTQPTPTQTPVPNASPTPMPSPTAVPPPFLPVIPQVFQNPGAMGIFTGPRNPNPTSTPQPRPAAVLSSAEPPPIRIQPPSTGNAGLAH